MLTRGGFWFEKMARKGFLSVQSLIEFNWYNR